MLCLFFIFTKCNLMINKHNLKSTHRSTNESDILALLKARDIRGIDALYNQYGGFLYGLICKIINCNHHAEIVLQDTFLKIWDKIDTYSSEKGRFVTWMMNVARNTAIDMTRSKHYKQSMKLISLDSVPYNSKVSNPNTKMENLDIKDIVFQLAPKYYEIIELVYFKGYTHVEVAKALDIPLGTVKGRIRKAFKDLRVILEE